MAVNVKSMNGIAAMKKLGVPGSDFEGLIKAGVTVTLNAKEFKFTHWVAGVQSAEATVPVTLNQLQKLNAGTLPEVEKAILKGALQEALANLVKQVFPPLELTPGLSVTAGETSAATTAPATLAKLPPLPAETLKEAPTAPAPWQPFDPKQVKTATPVKLRDATMMYQPVKGTSKGSRYYVVAANDDIRIAARYQAASLSIRIEGPNWAKHTGAMTECGLKADNAQQYASMHLNVPDDTVAAKTLGAVLMGLGIPLDTPVPDITRIKV